MHGLIHEVTCHVTDFPRHAQLLLNMCWYLNQATWPEFIWDWLELIGAEDLLKLRLKISKRSRQPGGGAEDATHHSNTT